MQMEKIPNELIKGVLLLLTGGFYFDNIVYAFDKYHYQKHKFRVIYQNYHSYYWDIYGYNNSSIHRKLLG